ncbi:MAG: glycosyltransferase family 4 protein [Caldilineaceae bacterium]
MTALAGMVQEAWRLAGSRQPHHGPQYVEQLQRLVQTAHLADRVTWHGACSDDAVRNHYDACDLFAAPAYEGFGIAYLEAMSFGLPVIASTAGAAHEIVTSGVDGYLVPPGDLTSLRAHLTNLCQNRALLAQLGKAARQRYERQPSWQESFVPAVSWLAKQAK